MANRNYQELFNDDMILVSKKKKWVIQKDDLYYYKILNLENHATINQEAEQNLSYMMREEHHILGLNPVCDIYYDHEKFLAYRTKIVFGKDVSQLRKEWGVELTSWSAFFHAFISVINFLTSHGYGLPDLYTKGNFLYQEANQQLVVIDNDGIQVKKSFTDIVDHIALETSLRDSYANYYNPIDNYFTNQYNAFAFYSWFYFYFFDVRLPFYLGEDTKFIKQVLRECGIQLNPWLWESTLDLFSNHPCTYIDEALFSDLAKDFKIDDHSRTLMYRLVFRT